VKALTYYKTLGVSPDASLKEIRTVYRRLVKECHPDTNPNDPKAVERFKRITEAYEVLSDARSRRSYDRAGRSAGAGVAAEEKTVRRTRSRNVKVNLFLSLKQVYEGGVKKIRYPRTTYCVICGGRGKRNHSGAECGTCTGSGIVKFDHTVKVNYPAGIRSGETLVIAGEGHVPSPKVPAGDLMVTVLYKPHPYLEVKGDDLHYHCLIGLDQYIQGGRLRIPTISGRTFIFLEPMIADGETINLNGRGLPAHGAHPAGNLVITVQHCLPKKLSRKELEKVRELMQMPGWSPPIDSKGLFPRGEV